MPICLSSPLLFSANKIPSSLLGSEARFDSQGVAFGLQLVCEFSSQPSNPGDSLWVLKSSKKYLTPIAVRNTFKQWCRGLAVSEIPDSMREDRPRDAHHDMFSRNLGENLFKTGLHEIEHLVESISINVDFAAVAFFVIVDLILPNTGILIEALHI